MAHARRLGYGEGSVYKEHDPDTGEVIRYRGELSIDGRRHRPSGRTRAEVVRKLDELRLAASGDVVPGRDTTTGAWLNWWLATVSASKVPVTHDRDCWAVNCLSGLAHKPLRGLRRVDLQHCLSALATRDPNPLGQTSCRRVVTVLRQAIDEAINHHPELGVTHNVAKGRWTPPEAAPPREARELSRAEVVALIEAAKGTPLHGAVVLMAHMPLRPGEVLGLRWAAVDLDGDTIAIKETRRLLPQGSMAAGTVKAHNDRTGALPSKVVAALRVHQRRQRRQRVASAVWAEPGDYVVCNEVGEPLTGQQLYKAFLALSASAGIAPASPYALRHSAISFLVDQGVPLQVVADLAGNTLTVMARHYRYRVGGAIDATAAQARMFS